MNISREDVRNTISKAFNTWSAVIPLNFTENVDNQSTDIKVIFLLSDADSLFEDRSGFVIPYERIYLFIDSLRTINVVGQRIDQYFTDFYYETLYNVGKVLGLHNSRNINSMMFTGYTAPIDSNGNYVEPKLSNEDIKEAQKIYGQRK
uniref:Peptidase M10 metallopeptidase domain-containing protein n=1 Tax=Panagrolaimus superbus TaxID=310955 RepID=A0A914YUC7_9BILA